MTRSRAISVATVIERSVAEVWSEVADIARHVDWMADAVAIRFLTDTRRGVGTRFACDTRIGPLSTTDVMEVTVWDEPRRLGVRHVGLVTGVGEFVLVALDDARTEFRWDEDLTFPWFLGGPLGALVARPVLRLVWRRNLARLKERLERG